MPCAIKCFTQFAKIFLADFITKCFQARQYSQYVTVVCIKVLLAFLGDVFSLSLTLVLRWSREHWCTLRWCQRKFLPLHLNWLCQQQLRHLQNSSHKFQYVASFAENLNVSSSVTELVLKFCRITGNNQRYVLKTGWVLEGAGVGGRVSVDWVSLSLSLSHAALIQTFFFHKLENICRVTFIIPRMHFLSESKLNFEFFFQVWPLNFRYFKCYLLIYNEPQVTLKWKICHMKSIWFNYVLRYTYVMVPFLQHFVNDFDVEEQTLIFLCHELFNLVNCLSNFVKLPVKSQDCSTFSISTAFSDGVDWHK